MRLQLFRPVAALLVLLVWGVATPAQERRARLGVQAMPADVARELSLPRGAAVLHVVSRSPADKAGIAPGDVIVEAAGRKLRGFGDLADELLKHSPGDEIAVAYLHGADRRESSMKLAAVADEPTDASRRKTVEYLQKVVGNSKGPAASLQLAESLWELGRRNKARISLAETATKFAGNARVQNQYLDSLFNTGRFAEYVATAEKQTAGDPNTRLHVAEAQLASGRLAEAEQTALSLAARSFRAPDAFAYAGVRAMRMLMDARIRQGKPLGGAPNPEMLDAPWANRELDVLRSWRDMLKGAKTYELVSDPNAVAELPQQKASVLFGLAPQKMHGITIKVNGVEVPLAIIDTGASHTLIADGIAQQANVEVADVSHGASGSLAFTARPGLIRELEIGPIKLRNVPVSVGNPPPLVMTKAKAALGIDLMHHLRFTIDYLNAKVRVAPAHTVPAPQPRSQGDVWDIPLYTFSEHTMTEAKLPNGNSARCLIDSGNFAMTLLWPTWGRENVVNHKGPSKSLFDFALDKPTHSIEGLTLGGRTLPRWPTMDMPPVTLQGVDLIDLLMGHDLLSQYVVTIDMQARRLRLETPGGKPIEPVPPKPMIF